MLSEKKIGKFVFIVIVIKQLLSIQYVFKEDYI